MDDRCKDYNIHIRKYDCQVSPAPTDDSGCISNQQITMNVITCANYLTWPNLAADYKARIFSSAPTIDPTVVTSDSSLCPLDYSSYTCDGCDSTSDLSLVVSGNSASMTATTNNLLLKSTFTLKMTVHNEIMTKTFTYEVISC